MEPTAATALVKTSTFKRNTEGDENRRPPVGSQLQRSVGGGVAFTFPPFNHSNEQLTLCGHSPLLSNEHRQRERRREKKASQTERKKEKNEREAGSVADLVYSVSQQVSLCLPNSLNHEIGIDVVN